MSVIEAIDSANIGSQSGTVRQPDVTPAFEARGLAVSFPGGIRALRGVDLTVEAGEILGVVGESGSGKSVLGLCALGLNAPSGRVTGIALLGGTDMVAASPEVRRVTRRTHAGAVFQDPMTSLNPTTRIGKQLMEVAKTRSAVLELLADVNVPEPERRFDQFPHELSGGLRQRVMIAMALARDPTLVIADEPTTALDVTVQAEIVRLFRRLQTERRVAFMFITHDLALAAQVSDRLVVLYGGRVAEIGPTHDVIRDPRHPYTAGLLATRLSLSVDTRARLRTLPGEPPDPRFIAMNVHSRHAARSRCPNATRDFLTSGPVPSRDASTRAFVPMNSAHLKDRPCPRAKSIMLQPIAYRGQQETAADCPG